MRAEVKMKGWIVRLKNSQKVQLKDQEMGKQEKKVEQWRKVQEANIQLIAIPKEHEGNQKRKKQENSPKDRSFQIKGPAWCPVQGMHIIMKCYTRNEEKSQELSETRRNQLSEGNQTFQQKLWKLEVDGALSSTS